MTEAGWLAAPEPARMLEFLRGQVSDRKLRLFACACCRSIWHRVSDPRSRQAVEVTERFADGEVSPEELSAARRDAEVALRDAGERRRWDGGERAVVALALAPEWNWDGWPSVQAVCQNVTTAAGQSVELRGTNKRKRKRNYIRGWLNEQAALCRLLRDIVGNPFRPVALDPGWRTSTVVGLARSIYAERAFDRLPILADALEDAGCDHADLLTHLRGDGPHVRGCWALDLVLGKE